MKGKKDHTRFRQEPDEAGLSEMGYFAGRTQ